jgi:membrane fusion protein, multidrug efflux system
MEQSMSRRLIFVSLFGLAAAGAGLGAFLYATNTSAPAATAPEPVRVPVVTSMVTSGDVPIYLRGVGTVIAYNNVVVRSQITGQLVKISFNQGQTVHQGDVLAEIDPRPYQAQLDQMTANRDRDQAQLINAQQNLNRYTQLGSKGWATPQLVETQQAQLGQLQAMVKSDEALMDAARVNLSYTQLTAPIDGVTGIRQIDNGNIIHPTDPNGLVDVTQIQPISIIFTLPETTFGEIQAQMAKGPLKVLAYSQDDKTELDQGTLELIDNQILQTTGTIRLRANFPNVRRMLWPGELVNARLLLETRHNGLTIPPGAVQQGPNGSYVYVIAPNETAQLRPVKVDQISDGAAVIDSGVQANEAVVVDGQYGLQPGSLVNVLHGKAAEQANLQSSVEQAIP